MKFDINFAEQSASDNLPDQSEDKILSSFDEVGTADVDDCGKSLCRVDDQIVVFDHLELTEFLAAGRLVENTFINGLELA